MLDLQSIRDELAEIAPDAVDATVTVYSSLPGHAVLPALVVGLPDQVSFEGSLGLVTVELPVVVVVGNRSTVEAEALLQALALAVAGAYRGATGTTFKSCRVTSIDQFQTITIGQAEALSAAVNLSLLASL